MRYLAVICLALVAGCIDADSTIQSAPEQPVSPMTHALYLNPSFGWEATILDIPEDAWVQGVAQLWFVGQGEATLLVGVRGDENHTQAFDWVAVTAPFGFVEIHREGNEATQVLIATSTYLQFTFGQPEDLRDRPNVAARVGLRGDTLMAGTAIWARVDGNQLYFQWGSAAVEAAQLGSVNANGVGVTQQRVHLMGGEPTQAAGLLTVRLGNGEQGGAEQWTSSIQHGDQASDQRNAWAWSAPMEPAAPPQVIHAALGSGDIEIDMERLVWRTGDSSASYSASVTWGFIDLDPASIGWHLVGADVQESPRRLAAGVWDVSAAPLPMLT